MSHLTDANAHLENALAHHAAGRHAKVRSCIEAAQRCVQRAIDEQPTEHDPVANPTAVTGAQVSSGQAPRAFDPEVRSQQDQLGSCQVAYQERMRQMRAKR
jgi:hypothetical protein